VSLRESLIQWIPNFMLRIFTRPYIAGNSAQSALTTADKLWKEKKVHSILDLLGEGIQNREDVEAEVQEYLHIIDAIGDREYVSIALKPTQMGLTFDPEYCEANIARVIEKAEPKGIHVAIDMEEEEYVTDTLKMYRRLHDRFKAVGTVIQSRLFRTEQDIAEHLQGFKGHIRLCIGIYLEPPDIAYQKKPEMKENFFKLLPKLWDAGHFVGIATHDEALIRRCLQLAEELNIPKDQYELQMLLGVPRDLIQQDAIQNGIDVALYVPYGTTWNNAYAYAKRRLAENPSIGFYVLGNLLKRFWTFITGKNQAALPPKSK